MGFITSSFIRKNTPELIKKLKHLGYRVHESVINGDESDWLCTIPENRLVISYTGIDKQILVSDFVDGRVIDCDGNDEMFIALSSMTDNKHDSKWFVANENIHIHYMLPPFCHEGEMMYSIEGPLVGKHNAHEASVQEIIDYFKRFNFSNTIHATKEKVESLIMKKEEYHGNSWEVINVEYRYDDYVILPAEENVRQWAMAAALYLLNGYYSLKDRDGDIYIINKKILKKRTSFDDKSIDKLLKLVDNIKLKPCFSMETGMLCGSGYYLDIDSKDK